MTHDYAVLCAWVNFGGFVLTVGLLLGLFALYYRGRNLW